MMLYIKKWLQAPENSDHAGLININLDRIGEAFRRIIEKNEAATLKINTNINNLNHDTVLKQMNYLRNNLGDYINPNEIKDIVAEDGVFTPTSANSNYSFGLRFEPNLDSITPYQNENFSNPAYYDTSDANRLGTQNSVDQNFAESSNTFDSGSITPKTSSIQSDSGSLTPKARTSANPFSDSSTISQHESRPMSPQHESRAMSPDVSLPEATSSIQLPDSRPMSPSGQAAELRRAKALENVVLDFSPAI